MQIVCLFLLVLSRNEAGWNCGNRCNGKYFGVTETIFMFVRVFKPFVFVPVRRYTTKMIHSETIQTNASSDVIDFGIGQPSPSLLPTKQLMNEFSANLDEESEDAWRWLQYGKVQGALPFRRSLAQFLNQNNYYGDQNNGLLLLINFDKIGQVLEENLFLIPGASAGLNIICQMFLTPKPNGEKTIVFVENPTYFLALGIFRDFAHVQLVGIPIDNEGIDVDKLDELAKQHKPSLLYTIPTFHNPTCRTLSLPRRKRLLELSVKHNFLIAADEVYQLLYYGANPPPPPLSALEQENTPTVLSIGPGLRLGWIEARGSLMQRLLSMGTLRSGGSLNHITSGIVQAALRSGFQQRHLDMLRNVYKKRLSFMFSELTKSIPANAISDMSEPEGGYFVWIVLSDAVNVEKLKDEMKKEQVGAKFGTVFEVIEKSCTNCLRLSFALYDEKEIAEGVQRLARAVKSSMQ